ncbi:MAG: polymer-forming cytoskeletal protein [Hyphomicrobiaceae bacterium]|nr:MAG: polymer-forming cytoskeletal protein [Hyphomicrobiaceae bacterium]
MFSKRPEEAVKPIMNPTSPVPLPRSTIPAMQPRPMSPQKDGASSIGADLVISGNLDSRGHIIVAGEVQGDIKCAHLTVEDSARITGGIVAEEVIVRGHVSGSIRGLRVTLQQTSNVEGDIFHKTLAIEQGAVFEGRSRRVEDPISMAPPGEAVAKITAA